jgi:glycosyltransferase involved in cell wall biosynthesis
MIEPLVSIVIPTYKRAYKIQETINSVLSQTYKNWELIIIDDNYKSSNDRMDTEVVMQKYIDHLNIKYIRHATNKGACSARNTGIAEAKGEYIAFLDDDDKWYADKLEKQLELLNNNPELGFVYCNMVNIDDYHKINMVTNFDEKSCTTLELLRRGSGICTSALIVKRSLLLKLDGFDASLPSYQDYDLLLRMSRKTKSSCIVEPLLLYEVDPLGISKNMSGKFFGKKTILKKYKFLYDDKLRRDYGNHIQLLADYAILSGYRIDSILNYFLSIMYNPFAFKAYIKFMVVLVGGVRLYNVIFQSYRKVHYMHTHSEN